MQWIALSNNLICQAYYRKSYEETTYVWLMKETFKWGYTLICCGLWPLVPIYIYIYIYNIKLDCVSLSVCLCVCMCFDHGLTKNPSDVIFGMPTLMQPRSVIGYIIFASLFIKGQ